MRRQRWWAVLVAWMVGASACAAPPVGLPATSRVGGAPNARAATTVGSRLSADEAGRRWGLAVARRTDRLVSFGEGARSVMVFTDPPRVLVNGASLGDPAVAGVARGASGAIELPAALVAAVEARLLAARADRSPSVPPSAAWPAASTWSSPDLSGRTVMLDAGHGGKDPGAPNRFGPPEKELTLDTARRVQRALESWGARVLMTRSGDSYPTLDDRIAASNRHGPDLFVSLHADAAEREGAEGFTVYLARQASAVSEAAAKRMVGALATTGVPSRGVQRANFRVVAETEAPALLVELGFLSNAAEAKRLSTPEHRQVLADAVARGVAGALTD